MTTSRSTPPATDDPSPYAYIAESAVWDFHNARVFRDEHYPDARQVCELYAYAARQALQALLIAAGRVMETGPFDGTGSEPVPGVVGINLVRALLDLRDIDPELPPALATGDEALSAARRLSRILHAAQWPAGSGYALRDLYDRPAVLEAHAASERIVEGMVRRLLNLSLDQLERRFHRQRKPPMRDSRLWTRTPGQTASHWPKPPAKTKSRPPASTAPKPDPASDNPPNPPR